MARKRKPVLCGLFDLRCEECGHYLVAAGDGRFLACPNGHGKLHLDTGAAPVAPPEDVEPCGLWIEEG